MTIINDDSMTNVIIILLILYSMILADIIIIIIDIVNSNIGKILCGNVSTNDISIISIGIDVLSS